MTKRKPPPPPKPKMGRPPKSLEDKRVAAVNRFNSRVFAISLLLEEKKAMQKLISLLFKGQSRDRIKIKALNLKLSEKKLETAA